MRNLDLLFLRQLEDELQAKERNWRSQRDEWRNEIDRLQEEIEKQQKLLSINLSKSPQTQAELYMQYEIARLTSENLVSKTNQRYKVYHQYQIDFVALFSNLWTYFFISTIIKFTNLSLIYECENLYLTPVLKDLQEKYDKIAEECRRFKRQCRILAKRLKDAGCKCNNYILIVRNISILCCNRNYIEYYKLSYLLMLSKTKGKNVLIWKAPVSAWSWQMLFSHWINRIVCACKRQALRQIKRKNR